MYVGGNFWVVEVTGKVKLPPFINRTVSLQQKKTKNSESTLPMHRKSYLFLYTEVCSHSDVTEELIVLSMFIMTKFIFVLRGGPSSVFISGATIILQLEAY